MGDLYLLFGGEGGRSAHPCALAAPAHPCAMGFSPKGSNPISPTLNICKGPEFNRPLENIGGEGGIRTLDTL